MNIEILLPHLKPFRSSNVFGLALLAGGITSRVMAFDAMTTVAMNTRCTISRGFIATALIAVVRLARLSLGLVVTTRESTVAAAAGMLVTGFLMASSIGSTAHAQTDDGSAIRRGTVVDVPLPMSSDDAASLLSTLEPMVDAAAGDINRPTVVLHLTKPINAAAGVGSTGFEDALRLSRALTADRWRAIRLVVWVDAVIDDHAALLLTTGEQILMSDLARIERLSNANDETFLINYVALAKRRGVLPLALVQTIASPVETLARVTLADGDVQLVAGEDLENLQRSGQIIKTDVWADATKPLSLGGDQLRAAGIISAVAEDLDQVAERLDLASLQSTTLPLDGDPVAARLDISGPMASSRTRRLQANLAGIDNNVNMLMVTVDSTGGDRSASSAMAASLVDPPVGVGRTIGIVTGEALGDAAIIAMACKPLYMLPDATIGGSGGGSFSPKHPPSEELIELIARRTGRSTGLLIGLLQQQNVHQFSNRRTGAIAYGTIDQITAGSDDPDAEAERWVRGELIELENGLSATEAVRLGLVDSIVESVNQAAAKTGLKSVPVAVQDRPLVRFIEKIGANTMFSFLLVTIGLMALSGEMNAPGLGVPGFIAMMCFSLFFWTKFLNGTAEWFELIVLALGLICIGIELFVIPGVGVFGVGGLFMTVLGIVLMSQTFVIPENEFQLGVLSRSVWTALGGVLAMVCAFFIIRAFLPSVPLLGGLVMQAEDRNYIDQHERLGNYEHLRDKIGIAATMMRPSGKAEIEGQLVPVVSDGSIIDRGDQVRVCEVLGTRVIVEPYDPAQTVSNGKSTEANVDDFSVDDASTV